MIKSKTMKKISREILKEAADKSMLKLDESDYSSLLSDFEIILQQLDLMSKIDGLDELEPMVFPFEIITNELREDNPTLPLDSNEALKNAPSTNNNQISLPRVVKR